MTILGARHTDLPWICFILPLGVFIYDATFTVFKRLSRGQNVLKAHREHHYQLLIRCGWSHARVTGLQMILMTIFSAGAIIYAQGANAVRLGVLAVLLSLMITYSIRVHRYFNAHEIKAEAAPADEGNADEQPAVENTQ